MGHDCHGTWTSDPQQGTSSLKEINGSCEHRRLDLICQWLCLVLVAGHLVGVHGGQWNNYPLHSNCIELCSFWERLLFVLSLSLVLPKCAGTCWNSGIIVIAIWGWEAPCSPKAFLPFLAAIDHSQVETGPFRFPLHMYMYTRVLMCIHTQAQPTLHIWCLLFKLHTWLRWLFSGLCVKVRSVAKGQWEHQGIGHLEFHDLLRWSVYPENLTPPTPQSGQTESPI